MISLNSRYGDTHDFSFYFLSIIITFHRFLVRTWTATSHAALLGVSVSFYSGHIGAYYLFFSLLDLLIRPLIKETVDGPLYD